MQEVIPSEKLSERVVGYLNAAANTKSDWRDAELLLLRAQAAAPDCLYVYYVLYKFYFNRNRLADADRIVYLALDTAARQAAITADWHLLSRTSCDWSDINSPQHFYLFSLKALSFIRLRQQRLDDTQQILAKLREIDPDDSVGASVIEAYAAGVAA